MGNPEFSGTVTDMSTVLADLAIVKGDMVIVKADIATLASNLSKVAGISATVRAESLIASVVVAPDNNYIIMKSFIVGVTGKIRIAFEAKRGNTSILIKLFKNGIDTGAVLGASVAGDGVYRATYFDAYISAGDTIEIRMGGVALEFGIQNLQLLYDLHDPIYWIKEV